MPTEVFRFATIRQPARSQETRLAPPLAFTVSGDTPFVEDLRKLRSPDQRPKMLERVRAFVGSASYLGEKGASEALRTFAQKLSQLPAEKFSSEATALLGAILGGGASVSADKVNVGDSIIAASIDYTVPSSHRSYLAQLAAALVVADAIGADKSFRKTEFDQPAIVLPSQLFPLPKEAPKEGAAGARSQKLKEQRIERERATKELDGLRAAVDDIVSALRGGHASTQVAQPQRSGTSLHRPPAFALNTGSRGPLAKETKAVLQRVGLSGQVDAAKAIDALEEKMSKEAGLLNRGGVTFRKLGITGNVAAELITSGGVLTDYSGRHPGPCPLPQIEPAADPGPTTVPSGHGEAKVLGIADLMIVEQKLARYELGEIAHIENVLQGETRLRSNKLTLTTEEYVETETEESEETEKDLSTNERFELQSEAQQVISENASKQAGITISASYGPTVEATANASAATTSSRQQSNQISSSYARETTARAVSRIQKRTRQRRSLRTTREFIERNLHKFESSSANVSGTYRFVDKIYTTQVVNYGKRLMLEFIVPEPAAFWRHASARQPSALTLVECPQEPGYCYDSDGLFHPLEPQDIAPDNYLFWAGQFGAEGVEAPPPKTRIVSSAKKGPDPIQPAWEGGPKISSDTAEIDIPDGYHPLKAVVNIYGETEAGDHYVMIQMQDKQFKYAEPWEDLLELPLHQEATAKIPVSINTLRFHNYEVLFTIFCVVSQRKYEEWQTKTYFAIMNAYRAAQSRYQSAVEAAQMSAAYSTNFGRSPGQDREIEGVELKRSCITMMSGQHFESFDAMSRGAAPYGYPEINLAEAKAESRFVRLFEHGIDWVNLTYVFYPYFWTRKDQWIALSQLSDEDPQFQQFLQAGAARVQVPVRLGFEASILNYLAGVEIWDADGNLINFDDDGGAPQLSMLQEMKSRLSNEYIEGDGVLEVTNGSEQAKGHETAFGETDERRRIRFGTTEYVIASIDPTSQKIRLDRPFEGQTDQQRTYALGPRLVGEPWEVRIPTSLVKLDDIPIS